MPQLQVMINRQQRKNGNRAITEYCMRKRERFNHTFTFNGTDGTRYYTVHGSRVDEGEFNRLFPIQSIKHTTHENIDSTRNFN